MRWGDVVLAQQATRRGPPIRVDEIESWRDGEPLDGELGSTSITNQACSTGWIGGGSLRWRETTIRVSWTATLPC